jgi:hypothetical protein
MIGYSPVFLSDKVVYLSRLILLTDIDDEKLGNLAGDLIIL